MGNDCSGSSSAGQGPAATGSSATQSGRPSPRCRLWIAWRPLIAARSAVKVGHELTIDVDARSTAPDWLQSARFCGRISASAVT